MPIYLKPSSVAKYAAQIFLVLCASAGLFISAPSAAIIVRAPLIKVTTGGFYVAALIDKVRALFVLTVALISLRVFLYRYEYIKDQKFFRRFHLLLFLFVVSILFLILSPNLVFSILG